MSAGQAALRILNLPTKPPPTEAALKSAFRLLAKKWHPDKHQGNSKVAAEAKFKELQQAYQLLSEPGALHAASRGESSSTAHSTGDGFSTNSRRQAYGDRGDRRPPRQEWWSKTGAYGAASQPGYDPHSSYMGFTGANNRGHWYEDTAAAADKEDQSNKRRMLMSVSAFFIGLFVVNWTSSRDSAAKARGDLVDAWFNQATRRWEKPTPHIYKDPFLSSLITLKPPKMVHDPATKKQMEAGTRRKQSVTLDGVNIRDAYRQREQGTRT